MSKSYKTQEEIQSLINAELGYIEGVRNALKDMLLAGERISTNHFRWGRWDAIAQGDEYTLSYSDTYRGYASVHGVLFYDTIDDLVTALARETMVPYHYWL